MNNINQFEFEQISKKSLYFSAIESLLFVCGEPMKLKDIANILECSSKYAKQLIDEMSEMYLKDDKRGIKIVCINEAYQLVTKPENSEFVQKILKTNSRQSLSQASLETLAIVAYKQPITRVDIDEIRGVKSDSAIQKLLERNLIRESGRLEVPGRPILYSTTEEFLKQFDLKNVRELPSLEDIINDNSEEFNLIALEEVAADNNKDLI